MKALYNTMFVLICILTLGIFDLTFYYSDGSKTSYTGWVTRIWRLFK